MWSGQAQRRGRSGSRSRGACRCLLPSRHRRQQCTGRSGGGQGRGALNEGIQCGWRRRRHGGASKCADGPAGISAVDSLKALRRWLHLSVGLRRHRCRCAFQLLLQPGGQPPRGRASSLTQAQGCQQAQLASSTSQVGDGCRAAGKRRRRSSGSSCGRCWAYLQGCGRPIDFRAHRGHQEQ